MPNAIGNAAKLVTEPTPEQKKQFNELMNKLSQTLEALEQILPAFRKEEYISHIFQLYKKGRKITAIINQELHGIYPYIDKEAGMWFNERLNNADVAYAQVQYDNRVNQIASPTNPEKIPSTGSISLGLSEVLEEGKAPSGRRFINSQTSNQKGR